MKFHTAVPGSRIRGLFLLMALFLTSAAFGLEEQASQASKGGLKGPQIILGSQKPPEFPPAAKAARFSGTVTMEVDVKSDGSVGDIKVVDCTHRRVGFEEASIAAVKQWRFDPAMKDGEPIEATLKFRLSFNRARPGSSEHVSVSPFSSGGGSKGGNRASTSSGVKPN